MLAHPSLFVTGTDTEVGKTTISRAIARLWREEGAEVCAVKAIAAGGEHDREGVFKCNDGAALSEASTPTGRELAHRVAGFEAGSALAGLTRPMAPWSAALLDGTSIDVMGVTRAITRLRTEAERRGAKLLVEGAGGVLVPLSAKKTLADLIAGAGIPVVIVTRTELGTINHTLLTVEALLHRGVSVAAIMFSRRRRGALTGTERAAFFEIPRLLPQPIPLFLAPWSREGCPRLEEAPAIDLEPRRGPRRCDCE